MVVVGQERGGLIGVYRQQAEQSAGRSQRLTTGARQCNVRAAGSGMKHVAAHRLRYEPLCGYHMNHEIDHHT